MAGYEISSLLMNNAGNTFGHHGCCSLGSWLAISATIGALKKK